MYLLLQIRCDGGIVRSCDLTFVGAYRMFFDKRSKVIKGSFTVKVCNKSRDSPAMNNIMITYRIAFLEQK